MPAITRDELGLLKMLWGSFRPTRDKLCWKLGICKAAMKNYGNRIYLRTDLIIIPLNLAARWLIYPRHQEDQAPFCCMASLLYPLLLLIMVNIIPIWPMCRSTNQALQWRERKQPVLCKTLQVADHSPAPLDWCCWKSIPKSRKSDAPRCRVGWLGWLVGGWGWLINFGMTLINFALAMHQVSSCCSTNLSRAKSWLLSTSHLFSHKKCCTQALVGRSHDGFPTSNSQQPLRNDHAQDHFWRHDVSGHRNGRGSNPVPRSPIINH